jgi:hypothetical protein
VAPPYHQTDTTRLVVIVTPMTKLSLAAQAVWDAFAQDKQEIESIAAALRAAADHIDHDWSGFNCVDALCEIAAELEAQ